MYDYRKKRLETRIRWLKEAKQVSDDSHIFCANKYFKCYKNDILPDIFESESLCDLESEEIQQHTDHLERDLADLEAAEFNYD
jgi:hypothetical protein